MNDEKLKAVCRILSDGVERQIFHFKENGDGSVNLRLKTGIQVGFKPDNKVIADKRISIHSSLSDPKFNLIKYHIEYVDGTNEPETYFKTDAIKSKDKFAHIATIRLSDLKNDIYNTKLKKGFSVISFGGFETSKNTAFVTILVGNRNSVFDCPHDAFSKFEIVSTHFKIIFICYLWFFPAAPTSNTITSVTSGFSIYLDHNHGLDRHFCNGSSVQECLLRINYLQSLLMVQHIDQVSVMIGRLMNPHFMKFLASLREKIMTDIGGAYYDLQSDTLIIDNHDVSKTPKIFSIIWEAGSGENWGFGWE